MIRYRTLVGIVFLFSASSAANAETRIVPTQHATIQEAIDASSNGDTVSVLPGSYAGPIDLRGKAITVRGSVDAASTIVSGGESVVRCTSGESALTVIENLTITGGTGSLGGGMRIDGASPTIRDCRILGNSAVYVNENYGGGRALGGGLFVRGGSPTITRCLVAANTVSYGAFYFPAGEARGGGLYLESSNAVISECDITGNYLSSGLEAFGCGAGASVFGASNPTFRRCRFIGNAMALATPTYGGCIGSGIGIYFQAGTRAVIENCEFRQQVNYGCGGSGLPVIKMQSNPNLIYVSGTLFCSNSGPNVDGVYVDLGTNTFSSNCPVNCRADLNGDGEVNGADLGIVLTAWGPCLN
jgi:hypothetical protein